MLASIRNIIKRYNQPVTPKYTNKDIKDVSIIVNKIEYSDDLREVILLLSELKKFHPDLISIAIKEIQNDFFPKEYPVESYSYDMYCGDLLNTLSLWEELYIEIKNKDIIITE